MIEGTAGATVDTANRFVPVGLSGPAPAAGFCPVLHFRESLRLGIEDGFERCGVRGCGALALHIEIGHAMADSAITVLGIVDGLIGRNICLGTALEICLHLRQDLGQLPFLEGLYLRDEGL
jgi:hypothetical protein